MKTIERDWHCTTLYVEVKIIDRDGIGRQFPPSFASCFVLKFSVYTLW